MTKQILIAVFAILSIFQVQAQDSTSTSNPVKDEFQKLIEESNNYQGYKVVDYNDLRRLQNNTEEYISELKNEITVQENTVDQQKQQIKDLKEKLETTQNDLNQVTEEKDALMFLGMPFSKGGYKAMMWGIVAFLIVVLVILFFRYKSSHTSTREARQKQHDLEKEFDAYRTKALEKEQKLGRMLQDERNKSGGTV